MKFEWHEWKRHINIEKHRVDFVAATEVFESPRWEWQDSRRDYGEERWCAVGWAKGRLITVAYTERRDVVRIISARKATRREEDEYFRQVRGD